jgi:hypothetical protein
MAKLMLRIVSVSISANHSLSKSSKQQWPPIPFTKRMATPQAYRQGVSTELSHLSIGGKKLFKLLMQINIRTVTGGNRIERKIRKLTSILISLRHLCFY